MVETFPQFLDIIGRKEEEGPDPDRPAIDADATFAAEEKMRGFPVLRAQSLVAYWSTFEACIEDLCIGFLLNEPRFLSAPAFARVKIDVATYESFDTEERMRFVLGEAEQRNVSHCYGAERFERLLEPFGFAGPVDDVMKKDLRALHHIRNVLVHRRGVVDRRLVEACPWLNFNVGEEIKIDAEKYDRYTNALAQYLLALARRFQAHYEKLADEKEQDLSTLAESPKEVMLKENSGNRTPDQEIRREEGPGEVQRVPSSLPEREP